MLKRLLNFAKANPQLAESFFSLSALNAITFLLPLVSLPYLLRILGPENFGVYSFVLVIIQYIILFSNYGFGLSATKFIAEHRGNAEIVKRNFSAVIFVRFIFAIVGTLLLFTLFFIIPIIEHEKFTYLLAFGIILGDVFIPVWFFQGMERMRFLTIVNLVAKGSFTILIFLFIKKSDDYKFVFLLNSFGYISAAILSMLIVRYRFGISLIIPRYSDVRFQLVDGWHIFVSTISMNLYRNANIFILGLFTNNYIVGIYSAAEKLTKAMQALVSPISEALFPFLSRKFSMQSKHDTFKDLILISKIYFVGLLILTVFVILFSNVLIRSVFGRQFMDSLLSLRILSFVILFGGMNYLLGIIGLINLGQKMAFTKFVFIAGIVNVLVTLATVSAFTYVGAAIGMVMSEIVLFGLCVYKLLMIKK